MSASSQELMDIYAHPECYLLCERVDTDLWFDPSATVEVEEFLDDDYQGEYGAVDESRVIVLGSRRGVKRRRAQEYIEFELMREVESVYRKGRRVNDTVELRREIITLPITKSYQQRSKYIASQLNNLNSTLFIPYRVVEYRFIPSINVMRYIIASVIVQQVPVSEPLCQYVHHASEAEFERLERSITQMQRAMNLSGVHIADLSADNLIVCEGGDLHPVRYYDIRFDKSQDSTFEFDNIRDWLQEQRLRYYPTPSVIAEPLELRDYHDSDSSRFPGHLWCGEMHEERVAVEDCGGYGFVDGLNQVVVESKYLWVDSFREGRAVVQSEEGYGVINIWGDIIVEPIYESIGYNHNTGVISARAKGQRWGYFSYRGEQMTPFVLEHPNEDITHHEAMLLPCALPGVEDFTLRR